MDERERILEAASRHCDIRERLPLVPASAQGRGLYFNSVETVLERAGKLAPYRAIYPRRLPALQFHPTTDFLERLVVGAAILAGPDRVHEGMFEIGRQNAVAFSQSLLGRALLRILSRDPRKLLEQAVAGRRQSLTYGSWELRFPSERRAVITMREEYAYFDSYMLGAGQGTFDAVDVPVRITVVVEDRFSGQHVLEW
ncbi:MAG TPA: TIGR02265 family protein [Polyangiaceae bacterium]|nr:TIGR02265 family protein [Polyangiaceae bacterium]